MSLKEKFQQALRRVEDKILCKDTLFLWPRREKFFKDVEEDNFEAVENTLKMYPHAIEWQKRAAGDTYEYPLHAAARYGSVRTARLLIKYDAPVNQTDTSGCNPLSLAALFSYDNTIRMLIEHGGTVFNHGEKVSLTLDRITEKATPATLQILLDRMPQHRKNITRTIGSTIWIYGQSALIQFALEKELFNINDPICNDFTLLMAASRHDSLSAVIDLLNRGAIAGILTDNNKCAADFTDLPEIKETLLRKMQQEENEKREAEFDAAQKAIEKSIHNGLTEPLPYKGPIKVIKRGPA